MANGNFKNKVMAISPHIEMLIRHIYWWNVRWLRPLVLKSASKSKSKSVLPNIDYDKVADFLTSFGVTKGSLIVVHSAYGPLKGRGKNHNEILEFFFDLIGETGTLAMPAMPKYVNSLPLEEYLSGKDSPNKIYEYDVEKSGVTTGVLPLMLNKRPGSVRSRFPINTMVASGPLAHELFHDEFSQIDPLACGIGSSWAKCAENDALIIGFGTDLTHSLTSIHVAEDFYEAEWPVKDWYINKTFNITNGGLSETKVIRERASKWGALHYAERTLCKDLVEAGILTSANLDGVLIEILSAAKLTKFLRLQQQKKKGYPYYWL
jgi:aminoglycoside 3-N-acetyltransferase